MRVPGEATFSQPRPWMLLNAWGEDGGKALLSALLLRNYTPRDPRALANPLGLSPNGVLSRTLLLRPGKKLVIDDQEKLG